MGEHTALFERAAARYGEPQLSTDGLLLRRERRERNRRIRAGVVALLVVAAGTGALVQGFSSERIPAGDPRLPFLGTWVSTDGDGSTQTMTVRGSDDAVEIVVRDDAASVCSGVPSTMTGTGRLTGSSELVIPSPVLTCDDGSEPAALSGPPLAEQLRNLTFVHDPEADALTDSLGVAWARVGGEEPKPTPTPTGPILRGAGEVLLFTGTEAPGDLVAVDPASGEERVLVEDLDTVYSARWSADGRWVAYETDDGEGGWELWVVSASQEPRLVATGSDPDIFASFGLYWMWSPTGAELATISRSTLSTIDFQTGETTDLGKIVADLLSTNVSPTWAWSQDGTRIAFGAARGALYTVDVRSGERSLLARLPSEDLPSIDEVMSSPDGAHIAVVNELDDDGRLYVMDADGSNVRVLAEHFDPLGVGWSPDGTRLAFADGSEPDRKVRIWVAPMDGAAPAEIGSLPFAGCAYNYECDLTWSPDGSQIAFWKLEGDVTAIDADGHGDVEPIDELTYRSWDGGWYSCECT